MLLLGIPTKQKAFVLLFAKTAKFIWRPWEKEKKSAVQPEKKKMRERESSLVPIISEQEVSGSFRLELTWDRLLRL